MRVVVIDDKESEIVADALKRAGHEAFAFGTGADAVRWMENNNADLILLDLALPFESGYAVAEKIKKIASTPIVFITGYIKPIDERIAAELKAKVVAKPDRSEDWVKIIV